jgi:hypothetical protein
MLYSIPSPLPLEPLLGPLLQAEDALARFDERLHHSPLAEGFRERILFHEICAEQKLEGLLVHLEDLVLFSAGVFGGPLIPELSSAFEALRIWQKAEKEEAFALLRSSRPGELSDAVLPVKSLPDAFYDPDWNGAERLEVWREALRETRELPPVLAAGIAWDAWLFAEPEQRGSWRAPLLAALTLKSRGKTKEFLLPLALGARRAGYYKPKASFEARMLGFCELVMASLERCQHELNTLQGARTRLDYALKTRRQHSSLRRLGELLLAKPVVSAPMAAKALGLSQMGVRKLLKSLCPIAREMSGRKSYRVWGI